MNAQQLEANKEIVRRLICDGFNQQDLSVWDAVVSPDCILKTAPVGPSATREAWKQNSVMLYEAFPDIQAEIDYMVAERDLVVAFETVSGTHNGPFMGVPATGNFVSIRSSIMFQIAEGKIVAQWNIADMFGLMAAIGAVAVPGG